MNTRKLVTGIVFLGVFAMAARISVDPDTWWHLRAGQWMLDHRVFLQVDPFSFTRLGTLWQYPGWLVEIPMTWIYRLMGPGGLNLWTAVMVTLAYIFLWKTLSGGPFLRAFVVVLSAAASGVYWAARPYLVTFLLAAVFLWILEDYRWKRTPAARRRLWWLPPLMIIWANSHGGFAVGFILLGIYLVGEVVQWMIGEADSTMKDGRSATQVSFVHRLSSFIIHPPSSVLRLFLIGLLMVAAVCLNPSGPAMLLYPFKTVEIGALKDYIQEWQSPDFHSIQTQPFIWLLLLTFGAVGISRRRLAITDFLLVSSFAYMGFLAGRNIALFALTASPVLSRYASPLVEVWIRQLGLEKAFQTPNQQGSPALNGFILGFLLLAVLAKLALVVPYDVNQKAWQKDLPLQAVEYLRQNQPPGRLFNSYNWGGYLLWALPEYPVFIDGRTDLYNDQIIGQWLQVAKAAPGWQDVLQRWDVHLILLESSTPVVSHLKEVGWKLLYQDDRAAIYAK